MQFKGCIIDRYIIKNFNSFSFCLSIPHIVYLKDYIMFLGDIFTEKLIWGIKLLVSLWENLFYGDASVDL